MLKFLVGFVDDEFRMVGDNVELDMFDSVGESENDTFDGAKELVLFIVGIIVCVDWFELVGCNEVVE